MKKIIAILTLAVAAAMAMTACNDVGTTSDIESSVAEEEVVTTLDLEKVASEVGLEAVPTERVREIVSADSFDYDVVDGNAVITNYTGKERIVEIPSELDGHPVTEIGHHAFEANYHITSVTIPESVLVIGEGAFMDCGELKEIVLPSKLKEIQRAAFSACTSLTELSIPKSVTIINEEAFVACDSLRKLTIENADLEYYDWGFGELPKVKVYAPEGSPAASWASYFGILASEDDEEDDEDEEDDDDYDEDEDDEDDDDDDDEDEDEDEEDEDEEDDEDEDF